MKRRILSLAAAGMTPLMAASAFAHDGEHGAVFLANVMHWLTQPSHSLFAVIGGIAVAGLIIRSRKKRA